MKMGTLVLCKLHRCNVDISPRNPNFQSRNDRLVVRDLSDISEMLPPLISATSTFRKIFHSAAYYKM